MNVLMIGPGKQSFDIRGKQLGAALGARVLLKPTPADLAWADVVVLIKWSGWDFAEVVRRAGKPLVWDALDFWRQPDENTFSESEARLLLGQYLRSIKPTLTIGATQAMADACDGVYLPHHARPGMTVTPVREKVQIVVYEGTPKYLGRWAAAIEKECARRGWQFIINPIELGDADLIVAFRDGKWDGWMCRNWKSGVKYVNAMAVGRPIITQHSAAHDEILPSGCALVSIDALSQAFDYWVSPEKRQQVAESTRRDHYTLENIAKEYQSILERIA